MDNDNAAIATPDSTFFENMEHPLDGDAAYARRRLRGGC
jgi:hypothetical protein